MTYPPPTWSAEHGQVSAWHRGPTAPPDLSHASGSRVHYLATGATTAGRFGLYRWEMSAAFEGPAPHFHRSLSESFSVLAGTVTVFDGRDWLDCAAGAVHVPEGGIHGFRNSSGAPASMLLHVAPGAPREGYFEGLPDLSSSDEEQRAAFFREHDTCWV